MKRLLLLALLFPLAAVPLQRLPAADPGPVPHFVIPTTDPVPPSPIPYKVDAGKTLDIPIDGWPAKTKYRLSVDPKMVGGVCRLRRTLESDSPFLEFSAPVAGSYVVDLTVIVDGDFVDCEVPVTVGTPVPPGPGPGPGPQPPQPPVVAPHIIVVSIAGCLPCVQMEPIVKGLQAQNVAITEEVVTDNAKYGTTVYPTSILYGSDGKEVGRKIGVLQSTDCIAWLATAKTIETLGGYNPPKDRGAPGKPCPAVIEYTRPRLFGR